VKSTTYSIFLLVILTGYILRPILPFVEYALNKDYIVRNLCINRDNPKSCCQGKCHLKKQLAKSDNTNESESTDSNKKIQNQENIEFLSIQLRRFIPFEIKLHFQEFAESFIPENFTSPIFVPPRFI